MKHKNNFDNFTKNDELEYLFWQIFSAKEQIIRILLNENIKLTKSILSEIEKDMPDLYNEFLRQKIKYGVKSFKGFIFQYKK